MAVAAILMVKDELDILEHTLGHLAGQVDAIHVWDNASTDGTWQYLTSGAVNRERFGIPIHITGDPELGYFQSAKMTRFAAEIRETYGYDWVLPCDADERWTADDKRPIRDYVLSLAPDIQAVEARVFHYIPSSSDLAASSVPSPFMRIGWRLAEPSSLPKTMARLVPGLVIEAGNHSVTINGARPALVAGGLRVDHYSWRSEAQYARKIRNGARAYAATDLPEGVGAHWRMWGDPEAPGLEERAADHFRRFFYAERPPMAPGSDDPRGLVWDQVEW